MHLKNHPKITDDFVVKLSDLGDSSLKIFVLYYIETPDWNEYMDIREEINFLIVETVHHEGIEFARPGSSLWIEKK
jgi:MscS family membrane protein